MIAAALAAGELLLPIGPIEVPLIPGHTTIAVYLLPLLVIAAWPICVAPPSPDIEKMLPPKAMRIRRTWWYLGATALLALVGTGALGLRIGELLAGVIIGRMVVFGIALATLCAILLRTRMAWVIPVVTAMMLWLYGTKGLVATAEWWAVPLYPIESVPVAIAAAVTWSLVGALYVVVDGRADAD